MPMPTYPATEQLDHVDSYHGTLVRDPFRWLEGLEDSRHSQWAREQNAVASAYLSQFPVRDELRQDFYRLLDFPRLYDLVWHRPYLFFKLNSGLQNQLVLCRQMDGDPAPEVLVDPRALAPDGTIALRAFAVSKNGRYLAYGISERGSEWEEYRIRDLASGVDLSDRVQWVRASNLAWRGDGFYYSRYAAPANRREALTAVTAHHQVWYHHVGTPQTADRLVYEDTEHVGRIHMVQTTHDERFVALTIMDRRAGHTGGALWLMDLAHEERGFCPIARGFDDSFLVVEPVDDRLLILTNRAAPHRRLVLIDPQRPAEHLWQDIIAAGPEPLDAVVPAGDRLLVTYHHHAAQRLYAFSYDGRMEYEVPLPSPGLVRAVRTGPADRHAIWTFTNFTTPSSVYRSDLDNQFCAVLLQPPVRFDADAYETAQVFYPSRDGTQIPMFLVHRRGLKLDGRSPLVLHGYGGYGACMGPSYDPFLPALLERGVVYAVPCLRGGGEYGEAWHRAGQRERKQTVFDDCIAAAEWLQRQGYTSADRCGLMGASNGGLLVGAVMTQRPELFQVAMPCAGILDMLRYQLFTAAADSIAEFGSSDDPAMFPILLAYSPVHNVREGVRYPATLVVTYDHDDCVVPSHSFKFLASLQAFGAGPGPYLLRVETDSGHGPVTLSKAIEERSDVYAFFLAHVAARDPDALSEDPLAHSRSRLMSV